jgi:hypothetical protein
VLTATSEQLHNVTRNRLQWDKVTILVSKSLAQDCFRLDRHQQRLQVIQNKRMNAQMDSSLTADVVIHSQSHPLIADLPHAKQFGGCGRQGLGVHLSRQFIRTFNSQDSFISGNFNFKFELKIFKFNSFLNVFKKDVKCYVNG